VMEVVAGVVLPLPMNLLRMTSTEALLCLVMMLELVPEEVAFNVEKMGNVNRIAYTRAVLTSGKDITRPSAQTRPSLVNSLGPVDFASNQATEPQIAQVLRPDCVRIVIWMVRVQS
jgi:hypothetical protein